MLFLMAISIVVLIYIFFKMANSDTTQDDIFGASAYGIAVTIVLFYAFPYFASLVTLLHSGLYSLKSIPFSKAKCLNCISSGLSLIIILSYILYMGLSYILYMGMISLIILEEFLLSLFSGGALVIMLMLIFFLSIILDIIGTILHKREQKRQLESADSQKTT